MTNVLSDGLVKMLLITARARITAHGHVDRDGRTIRFVGPDGRILKNASSKNAAFQRFGSGDNILDSIVFRAVAPVFHVSADPRDYLFLVARAVTADVPNHNGDCFPEDELLRFDTTRNAIVYESFQNCPLHLNHQAADRTQARGFLPDVHFNQDDPDDHFVETLIAVDRTKDPGLADDLEKGRRDAFSMGCLAGLVECSICAATASDERDLCHHLRSSKMRKVGGNLCFERCYGVTYTELSVVPDPADRTATTQAMLGKLAEKTPRFQPVSRRASGPAVPPILSMGFERDELQDIVRYWKQNNNRMPSGMTKLAERLLGVPVA